MKNLSRRAFNKLLLAIPAALSVVGLTGCPISIGTVWTAIQAWLPLGIDALNSIVDLLDPAAAVLVNPIVGLIKVAFADLAAGISDYINAPAADKTTLLNKIKLIMGDIAKHFQDFLTQLASSPSLTLISGLVKIILDTLAGFGVQIGATGAVPAQIRARTVTVTVQPTKRNTKQFEAAYNAAMDKGGHPELHIPRIK